jgi:hypothetical protein
MTGGPNTSGLEEGGIAKSMCPSSRMASATGTHICGIVGESCKQATTIDILPDDVVLLIFDFCRKYHDPNAGHPPRPVWEWHRLAHVCQRWRQIVIASPRRLDLQIYCTYGTPVREILRCWPTLPIAIDYCIHYADDGSKFPTPPTEDWNDVVAALKLTDRVRSIRMSVMDLTLEAMAEVLQRPYRWPRLASLTLRSADIHTPALPDAFLGGYVPRLRKCVLAAIPFPTFPRFLRSAKDLVELRLIGTPTFGSISAGMMVASLAAFTKLESLHILFEHSFQNPGQSLAVPLTRIVLPALTRFLFNGTREYLEELVAQMETPQLANLSITFSSDRVVQVPQLFQFIDRVEYLKQAQFRHARTLFSEVGTHICLDHPQGGRHRCYLNLRFNCLIPMLFPSMAIQFLTQLLIQSSLITSNVRDLSIFLFDRRLQSDSMDPTELWLPLLHPFTSVETLRCDWLAEVLGKVLEDSTVLPALQSTDFVPSQSLLKHCRFPMS